MICDVMQSHSTLPDCTSFSEAVGSVTITVLGAFVALLLFVTIVRVVWRAWRPVVTPDSLDYDFRIALRRDRRLREDIYSVAKGDGDLPDVKPGYWEM